MRTLFYLLLTISIPSLTMGQELTGKWKGYFTPSNELEGKLVSYEIDIKELPDHSLSAKTFSVISNNFTAVAFATGMYAANTQQVSITETRFDKIKLMGNFQACLMTNFLNYKVIRGREILEGTYTAKNETLGNDCGAGKVYLEKEGPIVKEFNASSVKPKNNISVAKETPIKKQNNPIKEIVNQKNKPVTAQKKLDKKTLPPSVQNTAAINKTNSSTLQNTNTVNNNEVDKINENSKATSVIENNSNSINNSNNSGSSNISSSNSVNKNAGQILPWVLVGRENKLVKRVIVSGPTISIDLYDNGTIDNDTIMIYDNKKLLLDNRRLSYKSTHFEVNFSNESSVHEIIIVAQNLGLVPPNTALMIVKDGSNRQEIYITSTLSVNAMIIFEQKKQNP